MELRAGQRVEGEGDQLCPPQYWESHDMPPSTYRGLPFGEECVIVPHYQELRGNYPLTPTMICGMISVIVTPPFCLTRENDLIHLITSSAYEEIIA